MYEIDNVDFLMSDEATFIKVHSPLNTQLLFAFVLDLLFLSFNETCVHKINEGNERLLTLLVVTKLQHCSQLSRNPDYLTICRLVCCMVSGQYFNANAKIGIT